MAKTSKHIQNVQVQLCSHVFVRCPAASGVMAILDFTRLDQLLDLWNWYRDQAAASQEKIEEYKTKVESLLAKAGTSHLATAKYRVERRLQSSEGISQKDVPDYIWKQYAKKSLFTTILTFKVGAVGKAKAKNMVVRAAGVKSKAKANSN